MVITSLTNAKVKQWMKYKDKKYREQDECFLIEGEHLVQEAHAAGLLLYTIQRIGDAPLFSNYKTYEVTEEILKKIGSCTSGSTIMALCKYKSSPKHLDQKIIILDNVQDPGNVGTIIRTGLSFGYGTVILSIHSVDIYNEKLIRSTQGAIFHMNILRTDIESIVSTLKNEKFHIYATTLQNAKPLSSIKSIEKHAIIFGNEGQGVRKEILALSDECLKIEMQTFDSLNVAVAAGICMYHLQKNEKFR